MIKIGQIYILVNEASLVKRELCLLIFAISKGLVHYIFSDTRRIARVQHSVFNEYIKNGCLTLL